MSELFSKTLSCFDRHALRMLDDLVPGTVWDIGCLEEQDGVSHYLLRQDLLSLDQLQKEGLLGAKVLSPLQRDGMIRQAYRSFRPDYDFSSFAFDDQVQAGVLYQLFARKTKERDWKKWDCVYRDYPQGKGVNLKAMEDDLFYLLFVQYELSKAWKEFSRACHHGGVKVIVHVPFPQRQEAVDAWYHNPLYDGEGNIRWDGAYRVLLELLEFYEGLADGVFFDGVEILENKPETAQYLAQKAGELQLKVQMIVPDTFDRELAGRCGFRQLSKML